MHFSICCGLILVCANVLLFLPAQGKRQPVLRTQGLVPPVCCARVSKSRINETVRACYEQKEGMFTGACRRHAFIFETARRQYCLDPSARWLPKRLEELKNRGITCKPAVEVLRSPREDDAPSLVD